MFDQDEAAMTEGEGGRVRVFAWHSGTTTPSPSPQPQNTGVCGFQVGIGIGVRCTGREVPVMHLRPPEEVVGCTHPNPNPAPAPKPNTNHYMAAYIDTVHHSEKVQMEWLVLFCD